ncbi:MAG: diguanylate cyclase [Desulfuromonadales bacterium]|nr:MAG: diguanylate cyclase [Desulfuromonadales bacterium]
MLVFLASVPLAAHFTLAFFRTELTRTVQEQQATLVARLAEELDGKIRVSSEALISAAGSIPPDTLATPARAEAFLRGLPALITLFDNGIFLFTPGGALIAEAPQRPSRTGLDLSQREYIRQTAATGRPYISAPFISSQPHHHPTIMFTAPIKGDADTLIGIMGGSIDLLKNNFLGSLAGAKIGRGGSFSLFTTDGTLIIPPERARIPGSSLPEGMGELIRAAAAGGVAMGETAHSGSVTLSTLKRLDTVSWILGADFPTSEAYKPVRQAERSVRWGLVPGGLLIVGLMWLFMHRMTRPMLSLTAQIRDIEHRGTHHAVQVRSGDEIESVADAFNSLMKRLGEKEDALYQLSVHDAMTGLYNRLFFEGEMQRLARGRHYPVSIVMVDVDNLKWTNDTLGHAAGDRLIRMAARALMDAFRAGDVVARIGGDEFAVILEETDEAAAEEAIARVREVIAAQDTDGDVVLSLSLGAATATAVNTLFDAWKTADQRMYADKAARKAGRKD